MNSTRWYFIVDWDLVTARLVTPFAMNALNIIRHRAGVCLAALAFFSIAVCATAAATPPRYDHIVIVMEENRTEGQIIGDLANAPYLTSLATGGVMLLGWISVYTLRMKFVPMTSGEHFLVHAVGFARTFLYSGVSSAATLSSS